LQKAISRKDAKKQRRKKPKGNLTQRRKRQRRKKAISRKEAKRQRNKEKRKGVKCKKCKKNI